MSEPSPPVIPPALPDQGLPTSRSGSFWRRPAGVAAIIGLVLGGLMFAGLVAFGLAVSSGMLPGFKAIAGPAVRDSVVRELRTAGVLEPDEKVAFLYSGALFDWLEDGNLFTDSRVISYWREDGELLIEAESFDRIDDIAVEWSDSEFDDTMITVVCADDREFVLYVRAEERGDRTFVEELKERWQRGR